MSAETPERHPRLLEITPEQRVRLDEFAAHGPSAREDAKGYHELHAAGLTDTAIHHELLHTYLKDPPGAEAIRALRGSWIVFGADWPDAPVTFLRWAEVYGRRMGGLEGVHELDVDQARRVRERALPMIAEGLGKGWTTRVFAHVVAVRTRPTPVPVPAANKTTATAEKGELEVPTSNLPLVEPDLSDEKGPDLRVHADDPIPGDPERDFSAMVELSRQLAATPIPESARARQESMESLAATAAEILANAETDRERRALRASMASRLGLDGGVLGEGPEGGDDRADEDDGDDDLDDMEFDS